MKNTYKNYLEKRITDGVALPEELIAYMTLENLTLETYNGFYFLCKDNQFLIRETVTNISTSVSEGQVILSDNYFCDIKTLLTTDNFTMERITCDLKTTISLELFSDFETTQFNITPIMIKSLLYSYIDIVYEYLNEDCGGGEETINMDTFKRDILNLSNGNQTINKLF